MTLVELRKVADAIDTADDDGVCLRRRLLALLDASMPCGWDVPEGGRDARGPVVRWEGSTLWLDEARGLAVALLRAADDAEAIR